METKINNKAEMYSLMRKGRFGNTNPRFYNLTDLCSYIREKHCQCLIMVRTTRLFGPCYPNLTPFIIGDTILELNQKGYRLEELIFDIHMNDDDLLLQGYVMESPQGLLLDYSKVPGLLMRESMKNPEHAVGLKSKLIMQHFLDPSSYDDIMSLLEDFPEHVVEFTTYKNDVGDCHRRNTIIWEVRNY